jgi:hypothetical protein
MSSYRFKVYRFQSYNPQESLSTVPIQTTNSQHTNGSQSILQTDSHLSTSISSHSSQTIQNLATTTFPPWRPSQRLRSLHTHFQNSILNQYICLPCAFCGRLLYPAKAKWIPFDENYAYPLEMNFPDINVYIRGEGSACTVCVCDSCKNNRKRYPCPQLYPIPNVIKAIPITQRRFLSPVFLHCSLGRNLDANSYTEYRTLTGDMEFSKNMRALKLYSGILGAFLTNPNNHNNNENLAWLTPQLCAAAQWLKDNNKYLRPFSRLLSTSDILT